MAREKKYFRYKQPDEMEFFNSSVTVCYFPYILIIKTQEKRFNALLSHYLSNEMDRARPSPLPYHVTSRGATLAI